MVLAAIKRSDLCPISQQEIGFGKRVGHGCSLRVIADLARADKEAQRLAIVIDQCMTLGVKAAFRASDQAPATPLL